MIEEPFFATIKMVTGEEVLSEVMPSEEHGIHFFVLNDPIVINENNTIDPNKGIVISGLIPKKWLLYSSDGMTIVNQEHIITMSEMDKFGVEFYKKALIAAKVSSPIKRKVESKDNSGYLGSTESYREQIKRMYEASFDVPE